MAGEVARGHQTTGTVSFKASQALKNLTLRVVPELQPFVQVAPTSLASVAKGQSISVTLTFTASTTAPFGTVYGTLQVRVRGEREDAPSEKGRDDKAVEFERREDNTVAKPLPVSVLVTVVPLPPDPGDAGKQTLAGIDTDNDGVRDDLERYIALTYPESARTRTAITQEAKALQALVLSSNDSNASIANANAQFRALECLSSILNDQALVRAFSVSLQSHALNTADRSNSYIRSEQYFSGQGYLLPAEADWRSSCTFDPNNLEN